MAKNRDELLQVMIEKMMNVMKSIHIRHCFPFGELKLSRPHVMILFYLKRKKEGVSSKELATFLNVTSGAITQFIDPLVEQKLVTREEDAKDRRIQRMTLTDIARQKFTSFKKDYYKLVSPVFNELSEKEIEQFIVLLGKIKIEPINPQHPH
jgi:DNA-binding MarR family transcriptional regulator